MIHLITEGASQDLIYLFKGNEIGFYNDMNPEGPCQPAHQRSEVHPLKAVDTQLNDRLGASRTSALGPKQKFDESSWMTGSSDCCLRRPDPELTLSATLRSAAAVV
jgi:hypothetical protein